MHACNQCHLLSRLFVEGARDTCTRGTKLSHESEAEDTQTGSASGLGIETPLARKGPERGGGPGRRCTCTRVIGHALT